MYKDPKQRPIYLNLAQFRFPANAIASILHRIAGVAVGLVALVALPLLLLGLIFPDVLHVLLNALWIGWLMTLTVLGILLHWVFGLRHLLAQFNIGLTPTSSRLTRVLAWWLIAILAITILFIKWGF